jgi:DNA primase
MHYNNLTFPEAAGFLAGKYGIQIPSRKMSPNEKKALKQKEAVLRINREAAQLFKTVLNDSRQGKRAQAYLSHRQMTPEITEGFLLGYASDSWTDLMGHFTRKGVAVEELEKAGLVVASKGRHYDRFRDRIMFPIMDVHERVVGFGGRSLGDGLPKYLNSPDTPVYHKSRILYGLHAAKEACRRSGTVFIVEGYFDLLALRCHGIDNVVATLGTALTRQHVRIMKGYAQQMTLVFDSDAAGVKAAERSLSVFMEEKVDARILILPQGKDPDSFIQEAGSDGFLKATESALGTVPFLVASAIQKHGLSLEGKVRVVEALKGPLGSLPDNVSRSVYIRDLSERLDIDESAILEQVRVSVTKKDQVSLIKQHHGSRLEKTLLAIVLKHPEMASNLNLKEMVEDFEADGLKILGRMIVKSIDENQSLAGADLMAQTDDSGTRKLISSLLMEDMAGDHESYQKILKQYQAHRRKQQVRKLSKRIKEAEEANDQELLSQLLAEKQKWAQQHIEAH